MARSSLAPQIVARILDHVRAHDFKSGQHLPAQALANVFRVSRAPVVSALKTLTDQGLLRSEPNRGHFLAVDASAIPLPEEEEVVGEDALYFQIAEDRLAGRLPDRLSENELMRLYGTPRSHLLRVLHRIAEEGWIDRLPGNGWHFRETLTSRKAYNEAYQFRAAIEMQALLLPSFRIDPDAFAQARQHQVSLLEHYEHENRSVIFSTNIEFHEMLMQCANNTFFLDAVRRINRIRRLLEYHITQNRARLPQQSREHLQILDLIEAHDMQAAAALLYSHIREAGHQKVVLID